MKINTVCNVTVALVFVSSLCGVYFSDKVGWGLFGFAFLFLLAGSWWVRRNNNGLRKAGSVNSWKMSTDYDVLDGSFNAQCVRVGQLVKGGSVTPELGSLLLSYYAMGRYEATGEQCDAAEYARDNFNPAHDQTMLSYRTAKPAKLIME